MSILAILNHRTQSLENQKIKFSPLTSQRQRIKIIARAPPVVRVCVCVGGGGKLIKFHDLCTNKHVICMVNSLYYFHFQTKLLATLHSNSIQNS
jgi:hypothetical protein